MMSMGKLTGGVGQTRWMGLAATLLLVALTDGRAAESGTDTETARRSCIKHLLAHDIGERYGLGSFKAVAPKPVENGLRFFWPKKTIVGDPQTTASCDYRDGRVARLTINGKTVME